MTIFEIIFSIILAIAPCLLICYFIIRSDKFEKEPWLPLLVSFALGMAATYPAILIEMKYDTYLRGLAHSWGVEQNESFLIIMITAFIAVALTEELLKFIGLMSFPYFQSSFNEPMDGIVYSVMVGMGFATVENIIYAYQNGYEVTLLRAFTAVPAHAVFAVIMGYYAGLAKFNKEKPFLYIALGFFLAVGVHGLYDFFIIQRYEDWLMILATLILVVGLLIARKFIISHQQISPFKDPFIETIIITEPHEAMGGLKEEDNEILSAVLFEMKENQDVKFNDEEE